MRRIVFLLLLVSASTAVADVPADPAAICPILPGESVPAGLTVRTAGGEEVDLTALLAQPTILVVYRGGWCPYCSQHMTDLRDSEQALLDLGYQLVALSPDRPGKAAELAAKLGESAWRVLSDSPMEACEALGIAFELEPDLVEKYRGYGIDLEADSGYAHHRLPVPAAFVITGSTVRFAYVNPDYKLRVDGEVLLAAARAALRGESGN